MYHNTTESTGERLRTYRKKALTQEARILRWFRFYEQQATPSKLLEIFDTPVPITSVRRALTNLTDAGELVKTDRQTKGPYGRPEFIWRLADKYLQGELF